MTLIRQLAPAATVAPQDFATIFCAKSPVVLMLLMLRVEDPVLVRVTVFGLLVVPTTIPPHFNKVGVKVTLGPLPATVRFSVVVEVKLPDVPVMVTVDVPRAAPALAVKVSVLVAVVGLGLNPAVTPLGRPEALKVTLPLNPFDGTTVIVLVPLLPRAMVRALGDAVRVKLAVPAQPLNLKFAMRVFQLKLPVVLLYSCVYQNVQSSAGSIVIAL